VQNKYNEECKDRNATLCAKTKRSYLETGALTGWVNATEYNGLSGYVITDVDVT